VEAFSGLPSAWNELIAGLPHPHLLQTWEWSQVKAGIGWVPMPFVWKDSRGNPIAAAMILKRIVPTAGLSARLCVLYVPKGPVMAWSDAPLRQGVLDDLQNLAKRQGAIFVKVDPDVVLGTGIPNSEGAREERSGLAVLAELRQREWLFSSEQIQFRNTVLIDLAPSEDEILRRMKQKTRYNIRLAEKKGVSVRMGTLDDLPMLYRMYAETSVRDGFVIRDESYYLSVWRSFMQTPGLDRRPAIPAAEPLIAEIEGQPVAAIFVFYFGGKAYYIYGMSRDAHREKMPNHLLQWEAMQRAKQAGCSTYDLWGAPETFDERDSLWGVFRFKEGLGGTVVRTLGAWDYPARPFWYRMYTEMIPRLLELMRSRGRARTLRRIAE
jgi:peptidoglycan pentaglycine glycine transferase (the first glycine)